MSMEDSILMNLRALGGQGLLSQLALDDGREVRVLEVAALRAHPRQVRALPDLEDLLAAEALGDTQAAQEMAGLRTLAESIKAHGLQQPIGVEEAGGETYTVVFGHRRWMALRLAGIERVPCVVWTKLPTSVRIRVQLAENLDREDLGDAERYEALAAYREVLAEERGVSVKEVPWGEVSCVFRVSDDTRKRIARLQRLGAEAYLLAKRARLSEWLLRPLLQHIQQAEEDKGPPLDGPAQLRIIQALVAAEEEPTPATVVELIRAELGEEGGREITPPMGRSLDGLKWERRWTAWEKEMGRLREQLGTLTADDQRVLMERATRLRALLDQVLGESGSPPHTGLLVVCSQ